MRIWLLFFFIMTCFSWKWAQEGTAQSCGKCHQAIYQEWSQSAHARAFTNPAFVSSLGDKNNQKLQKEHEKNCLPCHTPNPIFPALKSPSLRKAFQNEGVTCISCHQKGNSDKMCGPFDTPDAPHEWEKSTAIRTAQTCVGCHTNGKGNAVYFLQDSYLSWKKSKGKNAITCQDCHMPEIERPLAEKGDIQIKREGRKHTFDGRFGRPGSGKMNKEMLQKALTVKVEKDKNKVEVLLTNSGCGHSFPGMGFMSFLAEVVGYQGDKEVFRERQTVGEWLHAKPDTRIKPEETKKIVFSQKEKFDKVVLNLILKLDGREEAFQTVTQSF